MKQELNLHHPFVSCFWRLFKLFTTYWPSWRQKTEKMFNIKSGMSVAQSINWWCI